MIDVRRVYQMFMDLKRSAQYLMDHESEYMFSEKVVQKMEIE